MNAQSERERHRSVVSAHIQEHGAQMFALPQTTLDYLCANPKNCGVRMLSALLAEQRLRRDPEDQHHRELLAAHRGDLRRLPADTLEYFLATGADWQTQKALVEEHQNRRQSAADFDRE